MYMRTHTCLCVRLYIHQLCMNVHFFVYNTHTYTCVRTCVCVCVCARIHCMPVFNIYSVCVRERERDRERQREKGRDQCRLFLFCTIFSLYTFYIIVLVHLQN